MSALHALVAGAALYLTSLLVASLWRAHGWTLPGMLLATGPRDQMPEPSTQAARADRAAKNLGESLPIAAVVVLAAYAAGKQGPAVDLGAGVWLAARVLYVPAYLSGVPFVRTGIWGVSIAALGYVAWVAW